MGELSATILAAEDVGETSNFLIPNGTFFFVLLIFLVVLGVIAKWVVPPVSKVLAEREAMLAKTAADSKEAAKQLDAAHADYVQAMASARGEASSIRDEARTEGRKVVDAKRAEAGEEVSQQLRSADDQLSQNAEATSSQLEASVGELSSSLAGRILGVDVTGSTASSSSSGGGR